MKRCSTCIDVKICQIYKVARESQVRFVSPNRFGCIWHVAEKKEPIDTEGGAYIGESINVGGDFVDRDKIG